MTWGIVPGHKPQIHWGCRAIFEPTDFKLAYTRGRLSGRITKSLQRIPAQLDLVNDRSGWTGETPATSPAAEELRQWLVGSALPALRHWIQDKRPESRERFKMRSGLKCFEATPGGSYGYCYIGAWIDPPGTLSTPQPKAQPQEKGEETT